MNPHAFPHHFQLATDAVDECKGMTLRDYFAAKAMQSLIDSSRYSGVIGLNCYEHTLSALAYKQADAMLAERNKP